MIGAMSTFKLSMQSRGTERAGFGVRLVDQNLAYSHEQRADHQAALNLCWSCRGPGGNFVVDINKLIQRLTKRHRLRHRGRLAAVRGSALVTQDLDVCAVLSHGNVDRLRAALGDLHPMHRLSSPKLSFLSDPGPGVKVKDLYLRTDLGPLDILSSILGVR